MYFPIKVCQRGLRPLGHQPLSVKHIKSFCSIACAICCSRLSLAYVSNGGWQGTSIPVTSSHIGDQATAFSRYGLKGVSGLRGVPGLLSRGRTYLFVSAGRTTVRTARTVAIGAWSPVEKGIC